MCAACGKRAWAPPPSTTSATTSASAPAGPDLVMPIVQVYLERAEVPGDDPGRPLRTLAVFAPVDAEAGASAEVSLRIPARAFARYDEAARGWAWPPGACTMRAGRSSRDLRLSAPVVLR